MTIRNAMIKKIVKGGILGLIGAVWYASISYCITVLKHPAFLFLFVPSGFIFGAFYVYFFNLLSGFAMIRSLLILIHTIVGVGSGVLSGILSLFILVVRRVLGGKELSTIYEIMGEFVLWHCLMGLTIGIVIGYLGRRQQYTQNWSKVIFPEIFITAIKWMIIGFVGGMWYAFLSYYLLFPIPEIPGDSPGRIILFGFLGVIFSGLFIIFTSLLKLYVRRKEVVIIGKIITGPAFGVFCGIISTLNCPIDTGKEIIFWSSFLWGSLIGLSISIISIFVEAGQQEGIWEDGGRIYVKKSQDKNIPPP